MAEIGLITHDHPMAQQIKRHAVEKAAFFKFDHGRTLLSSVCVCIAERGGETQYQTLILMRLYLISIAKKVCFL
jgi:hypothetical protein